MEFYNDTSSPLNGSDASNVFMESSSDELLMDFITSSPPQDGTEAFQGNASAFHGMKQNNGFSSATTSSNSEWNTSVSMMNNGNNLHVSGMSPNLPTTIDGSIFPTTSSPESIDSGSGLVPQVSHQILGQLPYNGSSDGLTRRKGHQVYTESPLGNTTSQSSVSTSSAVVTQEDGKSPSPRASAVETVKKTLNNRHGVGIRRGTDASVSAAAAIAAKVEAEDVEGKAKLAALTEAIAATSDPAEKKRLKMEKNREAAAISRNHHKRYVEALEQSVTELSQTNTTTQQDLQNLKTARSTMAAQLEFLRQTLASFIPGMAATPSNSSVVRGGGVGKASRASAVTKRFTPPAGVTFLVVFVAFAVSVFDIPALHHQSSALNGVDAPAPPLGDVQRDRAGGRVLHQSDNPARDELEAQLSSMALSKSISNTDDDDDDDDDDEEEEEKYEADGSALNGDGLGVDQGANDAVSAPVDGAKSRASGSKVEAGAEQEAVPSAW